MSVRRTDPIGGWVIAVCALGILAFFVALYPALGLRVPIGSDSPVYMWWARLGGANGLGPLGTGARPASVGLVAALSGRSPSGTAAVAESLGPVLAVALALAASAFAVTSVRHPRPRLAFAFASAFVGAFLSYLVPGYLSTLAFLTGLVGMLAVIALSAGSVGAGSFLLPGALLAAAGLFHPLFLVLGAGVSAGAALAVIPAWLDARRSSVPFSSTLFGRIGLAWATALPVVGLGLAASGAGAAGNVDTSRDSVLRRVHLGNLLRESYRRKLHHDVPWWRSATAVGLALTALPLASTGPARDPADRERSAAFWGAMAAWLVITLGGVALLLLAGSAAPGQRLFVVCLALPILAGLGLSGLRLPSRVLTIAAAALGAGLFLAAIGSYWWSSRPLVTPTQVAQARAVGADLGALREGTPLVVVADDRSDKPGLFLTRYANVLRSTVPAGRVPDIHLWVGTPADLLRRRPTLTGLAEHDRMSIAYLRQALPSLRRKPLVVVVRSFDPKGYTSAVALPGSTVLAPGVVALPGYTGAPPAAGAPALPAGLRDPGAGPLSPWVPVWLAPLLLAGFGLAGWPWIRLALPDADGSRALALAPSVGIAAAGLGAVLVDAVGIRLSAPGGTAATGVVALIGWAALGMSRLRARRSAAVRASASGPTPDSSGSVAADPASPASV